MKTVYIKFEEPKGEIASSQKQSRKSWFKKIITGALTQIIPKANPEFEDKIADVAYWLLACNGETGIPEREVGLNKERLAILKMPYKDNYGYWTDNNLLLEDFKNQFHASEISKEEFENAWDMFEKSSYIKIEVSDFEILTTGADGGHIYLTTEIQYKNKQRKIVILFNEKSEESKVTPDKKLTLIGRLIDDGIEQSLIMLNTKLIDK